jgi:hypothetical protein
MLNLHSLTAGTLAQLVEQRTENPCVPGSIPGGTTINPLRNYWVFYFFVKSNYLEFNYRLIKKITLSY